MIKIEEDFFNNFNKNLISENYISVFITDTDMLYNRNQKYNFMESINNINNIIFDPKYIRIIPKNNICGCICINNTSLSKVKSFMCKSISDILFYLKIEKENITIKNSEIFIKNKKIYACMDKYVEKENGRSCTYLGFYFYCIRDNILSKYVDIQNHDNYYGFISDFTQSNINLNYIKNYIYEKCLQLF